MATPFVPGPCLLYAGVDSGSRPLFLGTAEVSPILQLLPEFDPVMNSLSGVKLPHDKTYQGEHAIIQADVNRLNEVVYAAMSTRVHPQSFGQDRGTDETGDRGTLMIGEGATFPLWLRFPYGDKTIYQTLGLNAPPKGYRFLAAHLMGPDIHEQLNTQARKIRLIWYCLSPYVPATGKHLLYDHNMTGLPVAD